MRESDLWGLDYGITDVAHRADDGGYKPLAARHQVSLTGGGFGWREGSF